MSSGACRRSLGVASRWLQTFGTGLQQLQGPMRRRQDTEARLAQGMPGRRRRRDQSWTRGKLAAARCYMISSHSRAWH